MTSLYTLFSNEKAKHLILKLTGGSSLNQGHTHVESFSPENELIASHRIGGQFDFDRISEIQFPLKPLRRKYKGMIRAVVHSTFGSEELVLELQFDEVNPAEVLVLMEANLMVAS